MNDSLISRIAEEISEKSQSQRVLYFASGGSSIPISIKIINSLPLNVRAQLLFTLTDERYGKVGHPDSNWQQFVVGGIDFSGIDTLPILTDPVASKEETAMQFAEELRKQFEDHPYTIALFGIGADSHIAGILPHSPAVKEVTQLVSSYHAGQYERITITPPVFPLIDSAYIYARGEAKKDAVEKLESDLPFLEYPNQLVKRCGGYIVHFEAEHN